jgi:AMP phosphorylase
MKLRVKNFNLAAGRPVVFLNDKTAKKLNIFVGERVVLANSREAYAIVDIFPGKVREGEIGLSKEISSIMKVKKGSKIEVNVAAITGVGPVIKKKLDGKKLNARELLKLMDSIVNNKITEAEIAYFVAAQKLAGMSVRETIDLTKAMIETGARLNFKNEFVVDKHCIGGVAGNRTTPIVVSICAAAGLTFPKTSSRAITSASGTADVIETISRVDLPLEKLKKVVQKTGACLAWGGSLGLAPSDDKIIHIERLLSLDVESQLLASIMSKKIAAGAKYLLIDIPYGEGAKVSSLKKAKRLGKKFEAIYRAFKIKTKILYTDGSRPIGNGFGPALEIQDVLSVLRGDGPCDLRNKSLLLASELLRLCKIKNPEKKATELLESGKAFEKFKEIINAQNGDKDFDKRVANLKLGTVKHVIRATKSGTIVSINNKGINSVCRILGSPETDGAGAYLHKSQDKIKKGEDLITFYSQSETKMRDAIRYWKTQQPIVIKRLP